MTFDKNMRVPIKLKLKDRDLTKHQRKILIAKLKDTESSAITVLAIRPAQNYAAGVRGRISTR